MKSCETMIDKSGIMDHLRDCPMRGTAPTLRKKELEVKLELAPASLPALKKLPLLRTLKPARRATEVSVYFDTDKHKLRKKGIMLRVRRVGDRHIQTIKAVTNSGSFERDEWETEIAGKKLDLNLASGTALEPLLNNKLRRRLKPLFETRVQRMVYPITKKTCSIALTVDRGRIDTGTRSLPLCEIELELKRGSVADLFDITRQLSQVVPARLAVKSKSERGYEIIDGEQQSPIKAAPVDLATDISTRDAFKTIGQACCHQIVGNEPALMNGDPRRRTQNARGPAASARRHVVVFCSSARFADGGDQGRAQMVSGRARPCS